ncbi:hypothetical protein EWM64_g10145 [Hericium alpestre]|uniref:Uncharacterized protein n=1 Tax=Hericium alpestre TaxID=135208 RepID=A0A4Y9ZIK7_9AGAM|nr:hypothetical protein EWM64_g10145 [Hericium alpestre]
MHKFLVALCIAFIACLATIVPARGAVARLTNAERLRRNLPPLPPMRRGSPIVAREGSSKQPPKPSAVPHATVTGRIQVRATNGSTIGFVASSTSGNFGVNSTDASSEASVTFSGSTVSLTSGSFLGANDTSATVPALTAVPSGSAASIWSLDKSTGNLTGRFSGASVLAQHADDVHRARLQLELAPLERRRRPAAHLSLVLHRPLNASTTPTHATVSLLVVITPPYGTDTFLFTLAMLSYAFFHVSFLLDFFARRAPARACGPGARGLIECLLLSHN